VPHAAAQGQTRRERLGRYRAAVRKALYLKPGDELTMRVDDAELRLWTRRRALERARRMIRQYIPDDVDLTQSLIDDRRAEAERE
jgi:bifunctional DNA-binding transcriptional regulator/antitoxin component of YhaV-PrlF toxin-antitoxin module